ncbi:MAG: hypothetical protein UU95_C0002G0040 [Parcubacteria group bacterium GW2011_GWC2_42_12]|uniref:histidine kinase n=1 Tax=Candidatus Falkowbacteria bacterium GW2011_GWA2_41_14 TaxID=1618635 RepID=A0A0G0XUA6_9BACT|nr:MAG: hypothetical protein UU43_C0005G0018 [Candidatus Falkowbacteria bacterium GW2011_GWA2_41_14]KKS35334.1 MAG: hypothetical protein UU95_C0002G0040 [Parcubacteria group bacterium GW2011_GWC2_42_12]
MNVHLIIHNLTSIVSSIILLGLALFTFLNGKRKIANISFALLMLSAAVFTISHVIGANLADPNISRAVFMFNLANFFIACFNVHAVISLINKNQEKKWIIRLFYSATILITAFFLIFPDLLLLPSAPKMYFLNYYEPGILNWMRLAFLYVISIPYMIYLLLAAYKKSNLALEKNQYKYFIVTIIIGYLPAFFPNFLVYDIQIDPALGMIFPLLFIFPFMYGAVKYELFNVKIIAKQAFFYSLGIAVVGGIITLLNYSNNLIINTYPDYPPWITAIISSILAVTISVIVWRYLREGDLLKYEFITTVTHKFRTPLTAIRWAAEDLAESALSPSDQEQIEYIKKANSKLVELTNLLVATSEKKMGYYQYKFSSNDLATAVNDIIMSFDSQIKKKQLTIEKKIQSGMLASSDLAKIKFVIQTIIENAINYTDKKGTISISIEKINNDIVFSVRDMGIGFSQEETKHLFSKFFRAPRARTIDTEGLGIGLYVAKKIILNHKGKIWAESAGSNKGSTFSFSLPAVKISQSAKAIK